MAENLILSDLTKPSAASINLVLNDAVIGEYAPSVAADVFWRWEDEPDAEPVYLGSTAAGKTLSVPFDLKGKPVRLFLVSKTARGESSVVDVRSAEQTVFYPPPEPEIDVTFDMETQTYATATLADGATENGTVALGRSFMLSNVAAGAACRIRLYRSPAYRAADASRPVGTDPVGEHGVILDLVLTGSDKSYDLSPLVWGSSAESPRSDICALAVTNMSGAAAAIEITFSFIKLEN